MRFLLKIAFRNLFRNKLRTSVSVFAIAFSVMVVVFARGYITGLIDSIAAEHIQYNSGHIKIVAKGYKEQERLLPLNYPVDGLNNQGLDGMLAKLQEINNVKMVIPRLKFGAVVSTEKDLVTMSGWGVDPRRETAFTRIKDYLVEGRLPELGRMEVMMGTALLRKINRRLGDKVTILFNTATGSPNGATFKIVGRLESGIKLLNEVVFYLPLDQAQRLLDMDGQVTELLLALPDKKMVPRVLPEVKASLADAGASDRYLALGYKETSDLIPYMEIAKSIYNTIYIFLVLLACIVVVNTMIMIVKERTKEIGMMAALGLEGKEILRLFMTEGAIMGAIGSLIGAVLGALINGYFAKTGYNLTAATSGFSSDIIFNSIVYPVSSLSNTVFAFALGVVVVTTACFIPARKAAKLEPIEAMRES